eukprot:gene2924-66862_t
MEHVVTGDAEAKARRMQAGVQSAKFESLCYAGDADSMLNRTQ